MKIVSWPRSRQAMAASTSLPCWRHRRCGHCLPAHAAPGETQIPGFSDRTMAALSVTLSLLGALFLEQLLEGGCKKRSGLRCSGGSPRSGYPRSDDDDPFRVVLPHGGIVLEQMRVGTGKRRWRVEAPSTLMTASLGGVEQRSIGAGRVMMVTCSLDMLSGVVATSTTCLTRLILGPCPEDDDGF